MNTVTITERDNSCGHPVWKIKSEKNDSCTRPCLWMEAGAVKKKDCTNFHDCSRCRYNTAMETRVAQERQTSWQDAARHTQGICGPCRHSLTKRFDFRFCPFNYRCSQCGFDQLLEDVLSPATPEGYSPGKDVKGFEVPDGYFFHEGHTWAKIESGGSIRIGFDDFALKVLGEADALDLPLMGRELNAGKPGWGFKRSGNTADVLSPVSGVIMAVNHTVSKAPGLANTEPYGTGWLFSVHTNDIKLSLKRLKVDTESVTWMNEEVSALEGMIEAVAGPLAADGGYLRPDVFGNLPSLGWSNLTRRFLRS